MAEAIGRLRRPLQELLAGGPGLYYFVTPALDTAAVGAVLPLLQRPGIRLRLLTHQDPAGAGALEAVAALRALPECQLRTQPELGARVFLRAGGDALVTSAALTAGGLDAGLEFGLRLHGAEAAAVAAEVEQWWSLGQPVDGRVWDLLQREAAARRNLRELGDEIARMGAFIRVSVRGTRRTRRLDPREFGLETGLVADQAEGGTEIRFARSRSTVRPVEVAIYAVPEVVRARDDLERVLADHGVEWSGYYFVPRAFADHEWPRVFAAREQALREWAAGSAGQTAVRDMVRQAQAELEAWFAGLYDQLAFSGRQPREPRDAYARVMAMKVLTDLEVTNPLENIALEYRTLQIVPEDARSLEEVRGLLDHPRFRSLQMMWRL